LFFFLCFFFWFTVRFAVDGTGEDARRSTGGFDQVTWVPHRYAGGDKRFGDRMLHLA